MSPRTRFAFLAAVLLAAAVCIRLGFWQLGRLQERRAMNATAKAVLEGPEMDLNAAGLDVAGHRVRASGEYDHDRQFTIRGQAYREQPGVHVATPLRLEGRPEAVLVLRGFVPAADAATTDLDSLAEPGRQVVRGVAERLARRSDGGVPIVRGERTTWRALDSAAVAATLPYPVAGIVIRQSADSALPRYPRRLPPPVLDDGPHLSYTIQWFAFATIALVGAIGLIVRPTRWTASAPAPDEPPPPPPGA